LQGRDFNYFCASSRWWILSAEPLSYDF